MGEPVKLGKIQETLLIPLYGRAQDAQNRHSVLGDRAGGGICGSY